MCDQVSLVLLPALPAAGVARRFAAEQCQRWGLHALTDDVVLTLSELVTNAVLHTKSPATVTMSLAGEYLEVAVSDDSTRTPILRPPRDDLNADIRALIDRAGADLIEAAGPQTLQIGPGGSIAGGRGMLIVDAIADEWGVSARSDGKEVWFRLRTSEGPSVMDCQCPTSAVLTPGGIPLHV